jgi:hypothetical protein
VEHYYDNYFLDDKEGRKQTTQNNQQQQQKNIHKSFKLCKTTTNVNFLKKHTSQNKNNTNKTTTRDNLHSNRREGTSLNAYN